MACHISLPFLYSVLNSSLIDRGEAVDIPRPMAETTCPHTLISKRLGARDDVVVPDNHLTIEVMDDPHTDLMAETVCPFLRIPASRINGIADAENCMAILDHGEVRGFEGHRYLPWSGTAPRCR
jgi:hypothetical protein